MDKCDYKDIFYKNYNDLESLSYHPNILLNNKVSDDENKKTVIFKSYLKSLKALYNRFDSLDGVEKEYFINENYLTNLFMKRIIDHYNNGEDDKLVFLLRKECTRIKFISLCLNRNMMDSCTTQKLAIDTLRQYKKDFYKIRGKLFKNIELDLNDYDVECISSMINFKEELEISNRDELERRFIGL